MFARYVLRLELTAGSLGWWDLKVGEKKGGRYIFSFRDVAANAEGGGASGNPFDQDHDQRNDYEQDTEEHEQKSRDLQQLELLTRVDAAISSGVLAQGSPPSPQANLTRRATAGFDRRSEAKSEDVRQPAREISAEPVRHLARALSCSLSLPPPCPRAHAIRPTPVRTPPPLPAHRHAPLARPSRAPSSVSCSRRSYKRCTRRTLRASPSLTSSRRRSPSRWESWWTP